MEKLEIGFVLDAGKYEGVINHKRADLSQRCFNLRTCVEVLEEHLREGILASYV
jgi:hypothetical protein